MNRTCSDLKYILFISDGFDRMFSSLWSYVVILCFLSKTSTPLPSSKLSGRGGRERRRRFSSPLPPLCSRELACRLLTRLLCLPFQGSSLCGVSLLSNRHRLCRRKGWNFINGFSLFVCFHPAQRRFKLPR